MAENHPWNPRLDVGVEPIDHEHHTQIALLSAFTDALEQGRPTLARRLGEELVNYSRAHFRGEELLMETKHYGAAAEHAAEHVTLLSRIAEVNAAQDSGNTGDAIVRNGNDDLVGAISFSLPDPRRTHAITESSSQRVEAVGIALVITPKIV